MINFLVNIEKPDFAGMRLIVEYNSGYPSLLICGDLTFAVDLKFINNNTLASMDRDIAGWGVFLMS